MERAVGHDRRIVEQFTLQAEGFAASPTITDHAALELLADLAGAGPADVVADVACGPGVVAAHLAATAGRVIGVDLTAAMLELAAARAGELGRSQRCAFVLGSMLELPFGDGACSVVVSRYTLHHALDPAAALGELVRICRPGGRVVVVDMAADPDPAAAAAYDAAEVRRDPSHVRNLTRREQRELLAAAGLAPEREGGYRLDADLETLLARSFSPDPDAVRRAFHDSLGGHRLGVAARVEQGRLRFTYPIAAFSARKPER
ncbi:MAG: class I SAM-dependent methyltransferase [Acidimicrobiales bacterium]